MNEFEAVLGKLRQDRPDLFEQAALREPPEEDLTVPVQDFDVPDRKDLQRREQIGRPPDLPLAPDNSDDWWEFEDENADFNRESPRAREEREGFEGRGTRAHIELLAVYRPFHLYPAGHWGVHFFERPMARFTDRLHRECLRQRLTYSWGEVLKMATYAVARHEFVHYLVELEALDLELKLGRRFYLPYWNSVCKRAYPGADCLEETVANVWSWDNSVIKQRRRLERIYRGALARTPAAAYARGASLDRVSVRPVEDSLAAQTYQCSIRPLTPPPVWGSLPRPYVQPWTRYENVPFTMNRSLGGALGGILSSRPLRKTIRIYHR